MTDVIGPTEWINPAYNLNPYGPAMVQGAMPPVAGGGPAPKSSGFGWGDLALPFLAGTVGLALGMRKPNITGPMYQLGALGSLVQMREQYGGQREEQLRLRNQEMFAKRIMEIAKTGRTDAVRKFAQQATDAGWVDPTEAALQAQPAIEASEFQRYNQRVSDQKMGRVPLMVAGEQAAAQPFQSTVPSYSLSDKSFPIQWREAPAQPIGGPQAGPSAVASLLSPDPSSSYLEIAWRDPDMTEATEEVITPGGKVIRKINVPANWVNNYVREGERNARAAGVWTPQTYGTLLANIAKTTNLPEVATIVEGMRQRRFEGVFMREFIQTHDLLKSAEAAVNEVQWVPPVGNPYHNYVIPLNLEGQGELQISKDITKKAASVLGALKQQDAKGAIDITKLVGVVNPPMALEGAQVSHYPVTQKNLDNVLSKSGSYMAEVYSVLSKHYPAQVAVRLAREILPGFPVSPDMTKISEPSTTVQEAVFKAAPPDQLKSTEGVLALGSKTVQTETEAKNLGDLLSIKRIPPEDGRDYARRQHLINVGQRLSEKLDSLADHYGGPLGVWGMFGSVMNALQSKDLPPEYNTFLADLLHWTSNLTHSLTGAQVGPREEEFKAQFPNLTGNTTLDFQARVRQSLANLQDVQDELVLYLKSQRYDVSNLHRSATGPGSGALPQADEAQARRMRKRLGEKPQ